MYYALNKNIEIAKENIMIIFRPHRRTLDEAMEQAKEFETEEDMKKYISNDWEGLISVEDIVIDSKSVKDDRIGWEDSRYVCTKRFGSQDNMKLYGVPQCIGMCATIYKKDK